MTKRTKAGRKTAHPSTQRASQQKKPRKTTGHPPAAPASLPSFRSEDDERRFWSEHDSDDYVQWNVAESVTLPSLKPSMTTISLRLPASLLAELKVLANKQDVPYQSLLKVYLAERIAQERPRKVA
jgi:predicted DNA binding CopG/RHH family protein